MKRQKNILLLLALSAAASCDLNDRGGFEPEIPKEISTVVFTSDFPVDSIEVFVYEADGRRQLLTSGMFYRPQAGDSLRIEGTKGDMIAVAIANYPYRIKKDAVAAFETMELLQSYYSSDNPLSPVLFGTAELKSEDCCTVRLKGKFAKIILSKVEHSLPNYGRLEDPRVFLKNAPETVELFRENGFRSTETVNDTTGLRAQMWDCLPCDVGMYAQYPRTVLYAYPNEDELNPTSFELECEIGSETLHFTTELPSLRPGDVLDLELNVKADRTFKYIIRKN